MAVTPTDQVACTLLARRAVGGGNDWSADQWGEQLADDALIRAGATYFRPYRSALAYLLNPERVKTRTEGQVSETYGDVGLTANYLREQALEWQAALDALDADQDGAPDAGSFDSEIVWGHR